MCEINAYLIQERLKNVDFVSVPWIQKEYELKYREAKEFLECLQERYWVSHIPMPDGGRYKVFHENLRLRKITRDEVDVLIDSLMPECIEVLDHIRKRFVQGWRSEELEGYYHNCDGVAECVFEILADHEIVFKFNERWFTIVSNKTLEVLLKVTILKDEREYYESDSRAQALMEDLRKEFDVLFEEE